jgi:hypothetical protein
VRRDKPVPSQDESVIKEMEALLISILGTRGQNRMSFESADEWQQIARWEQEDYLARIR